MNLPEQFINNMRVLLNNEFDSYLESLSKKRAYGLRANTLKIDADVLPNILNEDITQVGWCREGFYYNESDFRPAKHVMYNAGLYYIQEPSAMSPTSVLNIESGDRILDLCAAPGGKSTHIAAKLNGTGLLVSNDISPSRCKALIRNLEQSGVSNCIVLSEQPQNLKKVFSGFFDKILVDAPCSGEGMFRKDSSLINDWEPDINLKYSYIQKSILHLMPEILAEDGEIMYSTCTFSKEENEYVIEDFLNNNRDFYILPIDCKRYGFCEGGISGTARLFPHKQKGEGHFLAYLKRNGKKRQDDACKKKLKIPEFDAFADKYINKELYKKLVTHKSSVFSVPFEAPDLSGLRVMRSGFYLGDLRTKRFEPSYAMAMSLKSHEFRNIVNFKLDDPFVSRYLKGESFDVEADEGYALVCVESFPLGFGKVVSGRLKNKYPEFLAIGG